MKKQTTVSAIIPVFNEEKSIKRVITTLVQSSLISEVICINDGSTDNTLAILRSCNEKITIINLTKNHGKGFALSTGIKKAKGAYVAFFDGDLRGLTIKHIATLLEPLQKQNVEAVLGIATRRNQSYLRSFNAYLDTFITGERVYPRALLLPHLSQLAKAGYGVEVYLNTICNREKVAIVLLTGLVSPNKESKRSVLRAIREYITEGTEITQEIGKHLLRKYYPLVKKKTFLPK